MRFAGLRFGGVADADIDHLRACAPTYDHVGSTLQPATTPHAGHFERHVTVGTGGDAFAAAREALRSWIPQRSLGATVSPRHVKPDVGETVVLGLGVGRARLIVPNRIVATVEEPHRYAYAYGTLPGHPECGEELFVVEHRSDDVVVLTIRVDAVPTPALRRTGGIVRPLQRAALRRYLAAVTAHVRRRADPR